MKKIIFSSLAGFLIFAAAGILYADKAALVKYPKSEQKPSAHKQVSTATTTLDGGATIYTHFLDPEFAGQGVCIAIRDRDGAGYTYLSTLKGAPVFSQTSCE